MLDSDKVGSRDGCYSTLMLSLWQETKTRLHVVDVVAHDNCMTNGAEHSTRVIFIIRFYRIAQKAPTVDESDQGDIGPDYDVIIRYPVLCTLWTPLELLFWWKHDEHLILCFIKIIQNA